jgi:uncharacterized protein involved in outer membrane biogenesis
MWLSEAAEMKKLIRALVSLVVILVVLAGIGVAAVVLLTNRAVKTAVEKSGARTLNVPVNVGKASASVFTGAVGLQNITVANPPGYQGAALLKLPRMDAQVVARSLLGEEILIPDMKLANMEVFIEQKGLQNNLYQVIKPLHEPHQPSGKSLVIDNLEIANITVHVSMPLIPGQAPSVDLKLASIKMGHLGRNEKMDMAVLISKIVLAVAQGIAEQGGGILPKETVSEAGSVLDKAIDIGKTIFTSGGKTPDGQQQDSLGKTVTDGLKDLLGGKKK